MSDFNEQNNNASQETQLLGGLSQEQINMIKADLEAKQRKQQTEEELNKYLNSENGPVYKELMNFGLKEALDADPSLVLNPAIFKQACDLAAQRREMNKQRQTEPQTQTTTESAPLTQTATQTSQVEAQELNLARGVARSVLEKKGLKREDALLAAVFKPDVIIKD
jgi:hypothetical protein